MTENRSYNEWGYVGTQPDFGEAHVKEVHQIRMGGKYIRHFTNYYGEKFDYPFVVTGLSSQDDPNAIKVRYLYDNPYYPISEEDSLDLGCDAGVLPLNNGLWQIDSWVEDPNAPAIIKRRFEQRLNTIFERAFTQIGQDLLLAADEAEAVLLEGERNFTNASNNSLLNHQRSIAVFTPGGSSK